MTVAVTMTFELSTSKLIKLVTTSDLHTMSVEQTIYQLVIANHFFN